MFVVLGWSWKNNPNRLHVLLYTRYVCFFFVVCHEKLTSSYQFEFYISGCKYVEYSISKEIKKL